MCCILLPRSPVATRQPLQAPPGCLPTCAGLERNLDTVFKTCNCTKDAFKSHFKIDKVTSRPACCLLPACPSHATCCCLCPSLLNGWPTAGWVLPLSTPQQPH